MADNMTQDKLGNKESSSELLCDNENNLLKQCKRGMPIKIRYTGGGDYKALPHGTFTIPA
jgi:hypothetical protein